MESLEEIKLRLASSDPEQRIDALLDGWEHGTAGIELVATALKDPVREVRQSALLLLSESETEIAKQALWNYLPFAQMKCLHTISKFEIDWYESPKFDWLYGFAISNFTNTLVICWDLGNATHVHTLNLATGQIIKSCRQREQNKFGLGNRGKDIVFSFEDWIYSATLNDLEDYYLGFSIGIFQAGNAFAVTSEQTLIAVSQSNYRTGELVIRDYKTNHSYLNYVFEGLLLSTHHINAVDLWQIHTPPLFFTPDDKILVAHFRPNRLYSEIKLWNVQTGALIKTLNDLPRLTITSVGVRPNKTIIACGMRRKVARWKEEDKLCVWELRNDKIIYTASEVSPSILSTDGRVLIYATASHEIVIRDLVTEKDLCRLRGHEASVVYLALSEDRQFLASYSIDRQIKIWAIPNHS